MNSVARTRSVRDVVARFTARDSLWSAYSTARRSHQPGRGFPARPLLSPPAGGDALAYRDDVVASGTRAERRIISIASAPGWGALFEQTDDPIGEAELVTLAAWALVEAADGQTQLVGLVQKPQRDDSPAGTFGFADETDGFVGYSNQGLKTKPAD
jgi:hypothetical protein